MLLDEPTTHLDIANRVNIMQLLRSLVREAQKTIILSTHDLELALQVADRLWLMHDRSLTSGAPEDLVLNGSLARVMGSKHAPFDPQSGTFRVQHPKHYCISLEGSGTIADWTQRALERVGYQVQSNTTTNAAPTSVIITTHGEWQLRQTGQQHICHTIEELLQQLSTAIRKAPSVPNPLDNA